VRILPVFVSLITTGPAPCGLGNCIPVVSLFWDNVSPSVRKTEPPPSLHQSYTAWTLGVDNSDQSSAPETMSEESTTPPDQAQPTPSPSPTESSPELRQDLLSRAQAFLSSPQIRDQDDAAKRRFLTQKGLTPAEVDHLLQGIVSVRVKHSSVGLGIDSVVSPCRFSRTRSLMFPLDRTLNRHHRIYLPS